jgi:streptogramin lyase
MVYASGTGGNGSGATPLFLLPLITGATGHFAVTSSYVCPSSNTILYAVVTSASNPGLQLAAILGTCNTVASTLDFVIDEATTVAAAYAMAQFFSANPLSLASSATNGSGIALAAATAANLVSSTLGSAPGTNFPSTGIAPLARINTLANLISACALSTSACTSLFAAAGSASDTFTAAINIVKNPGTNVATLFTLSQASGTYSPSLHTAPPDWTLPISFGGGGLNGPSSVSIDSTGKLWIANYYAVASFFSNTGLPIFPHGISGPNLDNSFAGAVDVNDAFWIANEETSSINNGLGSIVVVDNTAAFNGVFTSGGINFPLGIAFDTSGVSWVVDYGDSHITLLDPTGAPLSGADGYASQHLLFPVAVATDARCNAYVANQSSNTVTQVLADGSAFTDFTVGEGPSGIAIDASGNIWSANYYGDSVGLVSSSGTVLSGTGYTGGGIDHPQGIAPDGSGNIWIANYRGPSLSELAGVPTTGSTSAPSPGTILSPAAGWAPDAGLAEAFGLAIDAAGNIWITNFATNLLTEFVGLAVPVQTPQLGPVRIP